MKPELKKNLICALIMLLSLFIAGGAIIAFGVPDGGGQVVVDDGKGGDGSQEQSAGVDLKLCRLFPIYHKIDHIDEDLELVDVVNDTFWGQVEGDLLDMQHLSDSGQELYKELVSSFDLTPPCVILVQSESEDDDEGSLVWSIPLDADTIKNVKEKLK